MALFVELLGCLAGVLTSVAYFPQIVKLLKTKQAAGISIPMYFCSLTGCVLWFFYGVIINSIALIIFNVINISSAFIVIVLSLKYQKLSSNNL